MNRSRLRSKTSSIKKGAAKVWRPVGYRLSQEGAPNGLQTLSDRFPSIILGMEPERGEVTKLSEANFVFWGTTM